MKQQAFEERNAERWREFERSLRRLERQRVRGRRREELAAADRARLERFPQAYREICRDLSLALQRRYGPHLVDRLNGLAMAGHRQLYARSTAFWRGFYGFVRRDFPRRVRREWVATSVATALFVTPGAVVFALVLAYPELVYSVLDVDSIRMFEEMYDPAARRIGTQRGAETDVQMFGFYIWNNIGIAFKTFASGILLGLGSVFHLVGNSLVFGGLSAHIIHLGFQETFFSFVVGHGATELTAIVIAGAAGLKLGYALVAPGRFSRTESLRRAAAESIELVYGVALMLLMAAFVEAFWSSKSAVAAEAKYAVGAGWWLAVFAYLGFAGRERGA